MIDFNKAKEVFKTYVQGFNLNHEGISLKLNHTYNVITYSEQIALSLRLNEEEILLSKLIALLHDIGRFEQIDKLGVFDDTKINHTSLGVEILFDKGLIADFINTRKYDDLIKSSIENHSLYKLKENLDDRYKMFAQILRDADKLDIFKVKLEGPLELMYSNPEAIGSQKISNEVLNALLHCNGVNTLICKSTLDKWLMSIGFIFDINYLFAFQVIQEKEYIDAILSVFTFDDSVTRSNVLKIEKTAKRYLLQKLEVNTHE